MRRDRTWPNMLQVEHLKSEHEMALTSMKDQHAEEISAKRPHWVKNWKGKALVTQ